MAKFSEVKAQALTKFQETFDAMALVIEQLDLESEYEITLPIEFKMTVTHPAHLNEQGGVEPIVTVTYYPES